MAQAGSNSGQFSAPSLSMPRTDLSPGGTPRLLADAPQSVGQRRPPYDLKYISQNDWADPNRPCFQGGGQWTANDAGCFLEPSPTQPLLILVINEDMGLLKTYREGMLKRKPPLDPKSISERTQVHLPRRLPSLSDVHGTGRAAATESEWERRRPGHSHGAGHACRSESRRHHAHEDDGNVRPLTHGSA